MNISCLVSWQWITAVFNIQREELRESELATATKQPDSYAVCVLWFSAQKQFTYPNRFHEGVGVQLPWKSEGDVISGHSEVNTQNCLRVDFKWSTASHFHSGYHIHTYFWKYGKECTINLPTAAPLEPLKLRDAKRVSDYSEQDAISQGWKCLEKSVAPIPASEKWGCESFRTRPWLTNALWSTGLWACRMSLRAIRGMMRWRLAKASVMNSPTRVFASLSD